MTEWCRLPTPYGAYEASSSGFIRRNGRVLKGQVDHDGYLNVNLYQCGMSRKFKVHRLICAAFHGPCPEGKECGHLDGTRQNNRASNLTWVTRSENTRHQITHGTHVGCPNFYGGAEEPPCGEAHPQAKLTDDKVRDARERYTNGESGRSLALEFGVAIRTMMKALNGETWSHIPMSKKTASDHSASVVFAGDK